MCKGRIKEGHIKRIKCTNVFKQQRDELKVNVEPVSFMNAHKFSPAHQSITHEQSNN